MDLGEGFGELHMLNFILDEGRKGNHLLFHSDMIRQTFCEDEAVLIELFEVQLEEINEVVNDLFLLENFEEKRNYLKTLECDLQKALIFGYFQLLDGQINDELNEPTVH